MLVSKRGAEHCATAALPHAAQQRRPGVARAAPVYRRPLARHWPLPGLEIYGATCNLAITLHQVPLPGMGHGVLSQWLALSACLRLLARFCSSSALSICLPQLSISRSALIPRALRMRQVSKVDAEDVSAGESSSPSSPSSSFCYSLAVSASLPTAADRACPLCFSSSPSPSPASCVPSSNLCFLYSLPLPTCPLCRRVRPGVHVRLHQLPPLHGR